MAIKLSIGGEGSLGDIAPGWSVNEYATPVAIGQFADGTGSVNINGRTKENSLLLVNNDAVTIHESNINSLGQISGVIQTVSETGIQSSITHSTVLGFLDAERFIPPLQVGSLWSALDLGIQLTRPSRINVEALP